MSLQLKSWVLNLDVENDAIAISYLSLIGPDERIWTPDLTVPNRVLYQAELHPDNQERADSNCYLR